MILKEDGVKNFVKISLVIFVMNSFAQEAAEELSGNEDQILQKLEVVTKGPMENFLQEMSELNRLSDEYIERKNEQCLSDKVSVEVNQAGEKILKRRRATKKEKKFCQFMLVNFKMRYTQLAFKGRKKYLEFVQDAQVKQLINFEKQKLKKLEDLAKSYQ